MRSSFAVYDLQSVFTKKLIKVLCRFAFSPQHTFTCFFLITIIASTMLGKVFQAQVYRNIPGHVIRIILKASYLPVGSTFYLHREYLFSSWRKPILYTTSKSEGGSLPFSILERNLFVPLAGVILQSFLEQQRNLEMPINLHVCEHSQTFKAKGKYRFGMPYTHTLSDIYCCVFLHNMFTTKRSFMNKALEVWKYF